MVTATLICPLTFLISWLTGHQRWWFFWVVLASTRAMTVPARKRSVVGGLFGPAWKPRQIERRLNRGR